MYVPTTIIVALYHFIDTPSFHRHSPLNCIFVIDLLAIILPPITIRILPRLYTKPLSSTRIRTLARA